MSETSVAALSREEPDLRGAVAAAAHDDMVAIVIPAAAARRRRRFFGLGVLFGTPAVGAAIGGVVVGALGAVALAVAGFVAAVVFAGPALVIWGAVARARLRDACHDAGVDVAVVEEAVSLCARGVYVGADAAVRAASRGVLR